MSARVDNRGWHQGTRALETGVMLKLIGKAVALLAVCGSVHAQTIARKATQEVFRRGGIDAPEPYAFPETPRLVVNDDGQIFARLANDGVVLVFDENGRFVRRIGRRGMGPGEFQNAHAHGLVGDTLWVVNWPTPRLTKFATSGTHLTTFRTPYDFGVRFGAPAGLSGLLSAGKAFALPPSPVLGFTKRISLPLLVGNADMIGADTVALIPNPKGLFVPGIGTWRFEPIPQGPLVGIDPRGDAIAVVSWNDAMPNQIMIRVTGPSGGIRWQRNLPVRVAAIPSSVRDSIISIGVDKVRQLIEAERRRGRGASVAGTLREIVARGLSLPRHYAPARRVLIGLDNSIWIEQMNGLSGGAWLVLDRDGQTLFELDVPRGFTIDDASAAWLWGTTTDDAGIAYLTKLRIVDP